MNKILILIACLTISACTSNKLYRSGEVSAPRSESRTVTSDSKSSGGSQIGASYRNMNNKTMRYIAKQTLFAEGCKLQSENWAAQKISIEFAPQTILHMNPVTGSMEVVPMPNSGHKVYNDDIPPFDMIGCLARASSTGAERFANNLIDQLFGTLNKAVPIAGGVLVAREVADFLTNRDNIQAEQNANTLDALATASENAAPRIEGDNNRVVVGVEGDSNTFNQQEGILTEPLTFDQVGLGPTGEAGELPSGLGACVDLRPIRTVDSNGVPVDETSTDSNGDGLVCSDGVGGIRDNLPGEG